MNEELNRKNKEITGLVVLVSILLIIIAFFVGQQFGKKDNNDSQKNSGKDADTVKVDDNKKIDDKKTDVNKESNNIIKEKDIYEKIADVKNDTTLSNTEKASKICNLVVSYTKMSQNISCTLKVNDIDKEDDYYYSSGEGVYIDKKMEKISIEQGGEYSLLKSDKNNIEWLKNDQIRGNYLSLLEDKLNTDDLYEYFGKKYNAENSICFEYSIDGDYFNINVVTSPRSWYNYDRYTGKCGNKIKDLVTYKFNTKTDKYEIIEK